MIAKEYWYQKSRDYIAEMVDDALENGDPVETLKSIKDQFDLAFLDVLRAHEQEPLALSLLAESTVYRQASKGGGE